MDKRVLLIINPHAGKMRSKHTLYSVIEELTIGGFTPTVCITQYQGNAKNIAKNVGEEYDLIVCSGGDGTLNEVLSGAIESGKNIPVGYIPSGSTNDFATTLGLSKDMRTATKDIVGGNNFDIDIGKFADRYFSYVASFGIFTKASYAADQNAKNVFGSAVYILEGIKDITNVHDYHLKIDTGDTIIEDDFIFGAVSNTTSIGGIVTIDPADVALNDGKFEYLLIKTPRNAVELMETVHAVNFRDYNSQRLYFGTAEKMKITWDFGTLDWSLDGEHCAVDGSVDIINMHNAVSMVLPFGGDNEKTIKLLKE